MGFHGFFFPLSGLQLQFAQFMSKRFLFIQSSANSPWISNSVWILSGLNIISNKDLFFLIGTQIILILNEVGKTHSLSSIGSTVPTGLKCNRASRYYLEDTWQADLLRQKVSFLHRHFSPYEQTFILKGLQIKWILAISVLFQRVSLRGT